MSLKTALAINIRVGKTGSLGPWISQNDLPKKKSFWQKDSLLQYTMTLLQGPKDPVLPTLMLIARAVLSDISDYSIPYFTKFGFFFSVPC